MAQTLDMLTFLRNLLNTPSPTGYHQEAIAFVAEAVKALEFPGLVMGTTPKGALLVTIPGTANDAPRALSGHIDTLGAMVSKIKGNGRLMLTQLGGYAWQAVEGENVTVQSEATLERFRGTIQTIHPSVHTSDQMGEGKRTVENIEVRLDVKTSSEQETRDLGIEVGDWVFLDPRVEITETGYVKSRHLDDKAGVAVMYGVLLELAKSGKLPAQRTSFFFSNYEEVGHGAAAGIPTDVAELLVIDMAASTTGENQNSDEYSTGICAKDSSGPYDRELRRKLVALCKEHHIPYRIDTYPRYGSDGSALLAAGGNLRVGLIGPGVDASHAYERTHTDSLIASRDLALAFVLDR